jgi:hypothetical protein
MPRGVYFCRNIHCVPVTYHSVTPTTGYFVFSCNLVLMSSDICTEVSVGEIYCYSYLSALKLYLLLNRIMAVLFPTPSTVSGYPLLSAALS